MSHPSPLPLKGVNVPLRATFTGIKGLPFIAVASNNASPKLCLFEEYIEFRVLRSQKRKWTEIAHVDAPHHRGGPFLLFVWTNGLWTFSAHLISEVALLQTLTYLQGKEVPLSPATLALLGNRKDA